MTRPIKFRGRVIESKYWYPTDDDVKVGDLVYGDLRYCGVHTLIFKQEQCYEAERLIEVDPDSVAQLVGFDADGNEVYEGDIIVDDIAEYVAHLFPNVRISDCKLKENQQ